MNQVTVFVVPGTFVLLQLLAGAELLADAEHTGEDALRWDLQIGGEESAPVEIFRSTALKAENMVDRGNHQVKVLLPVNGVLTSSESSRFPVVTGKLARSEPSLVRRAFLTRRYVRPFQLKPISESWIVTRFSRVAILGFELINVQ